MPSREPSIRGLNEFLEHIQKRPFHETLVDRFLLLIHEMPAKARQASMSELVTLLLDLNPYGALRACRRYLQNLKEGQPSYSEEIFALKLVERCFHKLEKSEQVLVIQKEIVRLEELRQSSKKRVYPPSIKAPVEELPPGPVPFSKELRTVLVEDQEDSLALSYERYTEELWQSFQLKMGTFQSIRHQRLAVSALINALDLLYRDVGPSIRKALYRFGRNPLFWSPEGTLHSRMINYFLESRVYGAGQEEGNTVKTSMTLELLASYHDQRLLLQLAKAPDSEVQLRRLLLEETLIAILTAESP